MKKLIVQIVIRNEYGEFRGEKVHCNTEQYTNITELSKGFYLSGFEMILENGSFLVLPPEIVRKSILLIEKEEIKD